MKINVLLLSLIVVLAFVLRFANLGQLPTVLNRDEAALAYNAYLLADVGQDEWQVAWPVTLKSFGDYKLPGYPYFLAALFSFLPLSDFLARLPSALAGVLLVLLSFFFARNVLKVRVGSALLLALFICLSPVFFFYSRIAFEANLALLFFILGLYFLFSEKSRPLLGAISLSIAVLTYNTPLLLLPFLIPALIFYFGINKPRSWFWSVFFLSGIFIFGASIFFTLASQKSAITIFNDITTWENYALYRESFTGLWQTVLGNQYVYYAKLILHNFFESFSLEFLVKSGGEHPWHSLRGFGHLFYITYFLAVFMLIDFLGDIVLYLRDKSRKISKRDLLLLYLTLISLAPSVVTTDSPHATRSLFFFFMMLVLAVLFFDKLVRIFPNKRKFLSSIVLLILLSESLLYQYNYFFIYPDKQSSSLFAGFPTMIKEADEKYSQQPVAVLDEGGYQYILTAWYLRVSSQQFFATMKYQQADAINFYYGESLLNYRFIKNFEDRKDSEKILISKELGLKQYD